MTHGHELDGVCVQGSLVARTRFQQIVLQSQVRGQLRRGYHVLIGNHHVASAVVKNTDDASVLHRLLSQVTHALARTFAIEILALQLGQNHTNLFHF